MSASAEDPRRIVIVGGGIGGLSAALALRRAGIDVSVYERAPSFGEVGVGISLWPNTTPILQRWGVLDRLLELGERVTQFTVRTPAGKNLGSVSLSRYPSPSLCLHRADLHRVLREQIPAASLQPLHRLRHFEAGADGLSRRSPAKADPSYAQGAASAPSHDEKHRRLKISVTFENASQIQSDGLVGADGIHSTVRAQLHGTVAPAYRGYRIWRAVAPAFGGGVRGHNSETWGRGRRFGIMPIGQGRICWYATRSGPASAPDHPAERKREIQELFHSWHYPIPDLIAATDPSDIIRSDSQDRPPLRPWGRGPVTLLGDAAHPITPNLGQGAGLAIEDADCLARCLQEEPETSAAFRAYEARRYARTAHVARRARLLGTLGQLQSPALTAIRQALIPWILRAPQRWWLDPLYATGERPVHASEP